MIGIFGGTFDPIHEGHLYLTDQLLRSYSLSEVLLVPARQNPHKTEGAIATAEQRVQMVELAIAERAGSKIRCFDWEIHRSELSYTIETVNHLRRQTKEPLVLIIGNDVFDSFYHWKQAREIVETCHLIVVTRNESLMATPETVLTQLGIADFTTKDRRVTHSNAKQWIEVFCFEPLPFSATQIRRDIQERWNNKQLTTRPQGVCESVWEYIKKNRIYAVN